MDPATIRYKNPGGMYPGPSAKRFGSTATETIGGGHKIAVFPTAEHGAAAQLDLLRRNYNGMALGDAIRKWSGGNSSGGYAEHIQKRTGLGSDTRLDDGFFRDPDRSVPFMAAAAHWEAGRPYPLDDAGWRRAHAMALSGVPGAPAAVSQPSPALPSSSQPGNLMPAPRNQQAPAGMLAQRRPAREAVTPPPAQAGGMDLSAISPEYAAMIAKMGGQRSAAPRNVGEGWHYIGEKISEAAWRNQLYAGLKARTDQDNKAWSALAGGGAPPGGMLAPPAGTPPPGSAPRQRPAPAYGGGDPDSIPTPAPGGMLAPQGGRDTDPPPQAAAPAQGDDPRLARIDAEMSRLQAAIANPATRAYALERWTKLEDAKLRMQDPMHQLELQAKREGLPSEKAKNDPMYQADLALKNAHAKAYEASAKSAETSAEAKAAQQDRLLADQARRHGNTRRLLEKLGGGVDPSAAEWKELHPMVQQVNDGIAVPYADRQSFIQRVQMPSFAADPFEPTEGEKVAGITRETKIDAYQRRALNDLYGVKNDAMMNKGIKLKPDGTAEPITGAGNTVAERTGAVVAKQGISQLDKAKEILDKSSWPERVAGDTWFRDSKSLPTLGGFGEAGRGFAAAEGGIYNYLQSVSGKQVTDTERRAFMRLYMPTSMDSKAVRDDKIATAKALLDQIIKARNTGAGDDVIGEMFRKSLGGPSGTGQRATPPQNDPRGGGWSIKRLD
jgi:hypothetical protein